MLILCVIPTHAPFFIYPNYPMYLLLFWLKVILIGGVKVPGYARAACEKCWGIVGWKVQLQGLDQYSVYLRAE